MKSKLLVGLIVISIILTGCTSRSASPEGTIPVTTPPAAEITLTTPALTPTIATTTTAVPQPPVTNSIPPVTTTPVPTTTTPTVTKVTFRAESPVSVFTDEDIQKLGVDLSGNPSEIANGIRRWQEENMLYGFFGETTSDAIRWNYFLPGIFPAKDIMNEHVIDGKVYGICFDFAVIYCSIAGYYGLECRIRNSISKPSATDPTIMFTRGMSPDEYQRLKIKLQKIGLKYDYEAVTLVAEETPAHYWAEVKIDGVWVIQDATEFFVEYSNTQANFIDAGDVELTDFLSYDKSQLLDDYQDRIDKGQRLPGY